jgi:dipeptidyl-peptidase-3
MYFLSDREKQLGLGEKGITKYFSPNCDSSDSDIVNKYLKARNIEGIYIVFLNRNGPEIWQR